MTRVMSEPNGRDPFRDGVCVVEESLGAGGVIRDVAYAVAARVGPALRATRSGFAWLSEDRRFLTVDPDWAVDGLASIAGQHRFESYGDLGTSLFAGMPFVVDDVCSDRRTSHDPDPLLRLGARALVNMPVLTAGRVVGLCFAHDRVARFWSPDALAFLRGAADRAGSSLV